MLAFPPPAVELVEAARKTAADILAERVGTLVKEITRLNDRELACGTAPLCVGDKIYYEKASVDALAEVNGELAQEFIRRGKLAAAASAIRNIKLATLYDGRKLIPARTRLYAAADVDAKLDAVLALLEPPVRP